MFGLGFLFAWCVIAITCTLSVVTGKGGIRFRNGAISAIILAPVILCYIALTIIFGALNYFFKSIDKRIKKCYNNHKKNKRKR